MQELSEMNGGVRFIVEGLYTPPCDDWMPS